MTDPNRAQLIATAQALGELCNELVFIGGSIVGLLITDTGNEPVRVTKDVDVIVKVSSRLEYEQLTERLFIKGFQPDSNGPICRYVLDSMLIDVMPLDADILGFSNRWYPNVIQQFQHHQLNNHLVIKVVTAPVFIATKFEAFQTRGANDPFMSHDLEDILLVVDGRTELLSEMMTTTKDVIDFVAAEFLQLQNQKYFEDLMSGTFHPVRRKIVLERISTLSRTH